MLIFLTQKLNLLQVMLQSQSAKFQLMEFILAIHYFDQLVPKTFSRLKVIQYWFTNLFKILSHF